MVATNVKNDPRTDWRGTIIAPGDIVIYGAGVGRSVQLVEGEVVENNNGMVKIKVLRRSFTDSRKQFTTMGHDRITVVNELPPCHLPTAEDQIEEKARREVNRKSHTIVYEERVHPLYTNQPKTPLTWNHQPPTYKVAVCQVCRAEGQSLYAHCPAVVPL